VGFGNDDKVFRLSLNTAARGIDDGKRCASDERLRVKTGTPVGTTKYVSGQTGSWGSGMRYTTLSPRE